MRKKAFILLENKVAVKKPPFNTTLRELASTCIIEVVYKRRIIPKNRNVGHKNDFRRMMCTANFDLVSHSSLKNLFYWKKPKGGHRRTLSWQKQRDLILVWDLMMPGGKYRGKGWRFISNNSNKYAIVGYHKIVDDSGDLDPDLVDRFLQFYVQKIKPLPISQRRKFSDTAK